MIHLQDYSSHKLSHHVLTCSELKTANIYWNTKAWALTAKIPKIHELPKMGKRTATALAVSLKEKMKGGDMMRHFNLHPRTRELIKRGLAGRRRVCDPLARKFPQWESLWIPHSTSVTPGITEFSVAWDKTRGKVGLGWLMSYARLWPPRAD